MPQVIIPDTLKVECEGTVAGRPWANIFHVDKPAVFNSEVASAIAGRFRTGFYGRFVDALDQAWTCNVQRVTDISSATGPQFEFNTPVNGVETGVLLSPDTAVVVTWLTALRGRSFRGRTYLCGFTEPSNAEGGVIEPATVANIDEAAEFLITEQSTAGTPLAIASRKLLSREAVVSARVNNVWDRQRRRNYRQ